MDSYENVGTSAASNAYSNMSIREIKEKLKALHVNFVGCTEKSELISLLKQHDTTTPAEQPQPQQSQPQTQPQPPEQATRHPSEVPMENSFSYSNQPNSEPTNPVIDENTSAPPPQPDPINPTYPTNPIYEPDQDAASGAHLRSAPSPPPQYTPAPADDFVPEMLQKRPREEYPNVGDSGSSASHNQFSSMSIRDLKAKLKAAGVDFSGCSEKSELVSLASKNLKL
ncbi:hypothetical protein Pelo_5654 [Pelomyxa schiedti]|nr:hypothetical protein Pelo_5654 [Pelomyxa schiedti]